MTEYDSYILCGTPRSGSTLFIDLLTATGFAGRPKSYFRTQSIEYYAQRLGVKGYCEPMTAQFKRDYLETVRDYGEGNSGLFGLRLMRENFSGLMGLIDDVHPGLDNDVARIRAAFGETLFIHLYRRNKLAQAISYIRAEQTGLWHVAWDGSERERVKPHEDAVYDHDLIAETIAELEAHDAEWRDWFDQNGVTPVTMAYEDLALDPQVYLGDILEALGRDAGIAASIVPLTQKLADAESVEWEQRFLNEMTR